MKKDSAANSASAWRLEGRVLFLDRCLGKSVVADALRAHGLSVVTHFDEYPLTERDPEPHDADWLRDVGRRGWVILSKDKHLDRNQVELAGLLESGAPCFVLTGGGMTGAAMADAFLNAMPSIGRFLDKFTPPFVARISSSGTVQMHLTQSGIIKKIQ